MKKEYALVKKECIIPLLEIIEGLLDHIGHDSFYAPSYVRLRILLNNTKTDYEIENLVVFIKVLKNRIKSFTNENEKK